MPSRYHLLLASLPQIPHFERLKALPIGPRRFEERLALLSADDQVAVGWMRAALWPERNGFRRVGNDADPGALPSSVRILAGQAAAIRRAYAKRRDEEDVAALEKERLGALWTSADRLARPYGFGLDAVLRAVVRWDVTTAWLAADRAGSVARIEGCVAAVLAGAGMPAAGEGEQGR